MQSSMPDTTNLVQQPKENLHTRQFPPDQIR